MYLYIYSSYSLTTVTNKMKNDQNKLSYHERLLLDVLKENKIDASFHHSTDLFDSIYGEIKEFFQKITDDTLGKLIDALHRKGYLIKDHLGRFRLRQDSEFTQIAILGKITAGHLQEAISDPLGYVRFFGSVPQPQQLFAFQVTGDSMIGDNIEDGDCVLLRNVEIRNGQIGAVIVNGETTLKRIYKEHGLLRLVPSNPNYDPIHILPEDISSCRILGRLDAVISNRTGEVRWVNPNTDVTELTIFLN